MVLHSLVLVPAQRIQQQVVFPPTEGVSTFPHVQITPLCNIVATFFDTHVSRHNEIGAALADPKLDALTLLGVGVTDFFYASRYIIPLKCLEQALVHTKRNKHFFMLNCRDLLFVYQYIRIMYSHYPMYSLTKNAAHTHTLYTHTHPEY